MPFFAGLAFFVFTRGLMPGLGEMLIAASSASAVGDQYALSRYSEIGERFSGLIVENQRAYRNLQDHFVAGVDGAVGAFAMAAAVGFEFAVVAITQQRVVVGIGFQVDAAAVAAIA